MDYVTKDTIVTETKSHTLYAYWLNGKTYKITYFTNGGTINSGLVESYTYRVGATLPTDVTMAGYTFAGWYEDRECVGARVDAVYVWEYGDKVFYAKWNPSTYTVAFNANGGTVSPSSLTVAYGLPYGMYGDFPTPAKDGNVFEGWFTDPANGDRIKESDTFVQTSSQTLYAHWTEDVPPTPVPWTVVKYKIKLNLNGGTLAESYGELKYTMGVEKALPTGEEVTKEGCTFLGWYSKADFSGSAQTSIPATAKNTKTYYAKWGSEGA